MAAAAVLVRRIDVVKLWDVSDRKAAPAPPLPAAANLLPSSTPRLSETSPAPRDRAVMMSATLCSSNILRAGHKHSTDTCQKQLGLLNLPDTPDKYCCHIFNINLYPAQIFYCHPYMISKIFNISLLKKNKEKKRLPDGIRSNDVLSGQPPIQ